MAGLNLRRHAELASCAGAGAARRQSIPFTVKLDYIRREPYIISDGPYVWRAQSGLCGPADRSVKQASSGQQAARPYKGENRYYW